MSHTPTTPIGDDRPFKILDRAAVPDEHKERLFQVVRTVQEIVSGRGEELQGEYGREAVAMIIGCNQFVRLYRGGDCAGRVELLLEEADKKALQEAGFTLHEPQGQVFKLFGWVSVDPMEGSLEGLCQAAAAALGKASA